MSPDQGLLLPLLVHHHKVEHGVGQAARACLLLVHNNILVSETDIFIRTAVPVPSQPVCYQLVVESLDALPAIFELLSMLFNQFDLFVQGLFIVGNTAVNHFLLSRHVVHSSD